LSGWVRIGPNATTSTCATSRGRSALLLGKAKDNSASCAIGLFIRLFDAHFGIVDVRSCELLLQVEGPLDASTQSSRSLLADADSDACS